VNFDVDDVTELSLVRSLWCWVPMSSSLSWVCLEVNQRSRTRFAPCACCLDLTSVLTSLLSRHLTMLDCSSSSHTTG